MKKFGFTLTEVVIALGIIGVVAAITAPILNSLIPDKDKIDVLKTYNIIRTINDDIKEDRTLWRETFNEDAAGWGHLANLEAEGDYPHIFSEKIDFVEASISPSARGLEFDTTDGHHWVVEDYESNYGHIIVDFMNEKKDRCTYNSTNCTNPGQFRFQILAETLNTLPGDALTAAYIKNSQNLNDKKADYRTAKNDNHNYYLD